MAYEIAICDDEKEQMESIASMVRAWGESSGHACHLHLFASAEAFLFEYEENKVFDILLLDIQMEGISGMELAKRIRKEKSRAEIIFVTSHFEFAGEGYEVDALHYLLKPVQEDKLASVLAKAAGRLAIEPPFVVFNCNGEIVKLWEENIWYVEAFLHYISIHTEEKEYKIKENISSFQDKLSEDFFRIHRSYLVSLKHITKISRASVFLEGGQELPLARGKYDAINQAFIERW